MNLRSVDLNLLVVLDALLDEAHVSRAAERLNLSQPAVSSALQRCRDLFADDLLKRGRGTMHRTRKAEALRAPLKSLLAGMHRLIDPPELPLAELRQTVRIVTSDSIVAVLAGPLLAELRVSAPGLDIIFLPWHGAESTQLSLFNGDADIALSVVERDVPGLERRRILFHRFAVAMRREHPAARKFDLQAWLDWPHVVVSGRGDARTPLDRELEAGGRRRRIGLVVPSFHIVPELLLETDLIAMLPSGTIPAAMRPRLAVFDPPVPVPGFPMHIAWHGRRTGDQALRHLIEVVPALLAPAGQDRSVPPA